MVLEARETSGPSSDLEELVEVPVVFFVVLVLLLVVVPVVLLPLEVEEDDEVLPVVLPLVPVVPP